jgi:hypothetical protein
MDIGSRIKKPMVAAAVCCVFFPVLVRAQDTTGPKPALHPRVFIDSYYSYDFNRPPAHQKAPFLFNHNRHNEVAINLALASLSYNGERTRGTLGLMTGTYAQYNLAAEPSVLRHLFEANAGVKLSAKNDLWVDAGVMPSHIGFESAISKDCWTLTRSILAENSPYFETGARLSFTTPNEKWYLAGLFLNGWQRIARLPGNQAPAFGTQATFTPNERWTINWSTFAGNEKPDSVRQQRWFSNLYVVGQLSGHWGLTIGVDQGWEQTLRGAATYHQWYSPVVILRYTAGDWAVAARAEYYSDKAGVMMPLVNAGPFRMQGYSINADRKMGANALWRVEWRLLRNKEPYFEKEGRLRTTNAYLTTSLAIDLR